MINDTQKKIRGFMLIVVLAVLAISGCSTTKPHSIEDHKMCPLCGMYPARYPIFQCQIVFSDGTYEAFDSPVGLLIYMLFPDKTEIPIKPPAKIYFRDYTDRSWIEAENTYFIVGSEVMSPMGLDFLPVKNEEDAERLRNEEKGAVMVHYNQVDRDFMTKAANSNWVHFLARKIILE